jgi:Protein of unknown function (DUF2911)
MMAQSKEIFTLQNNMKALVMFVMGWLMLSQSFAQNSERVSPLDVASYRYKDAYAKVMYGRPAKKNREIFGKLVPYGQVWRTGANEATEITFSRDVLIAGKAIPAGTYSLFTIPQQNTWTIILNKDLGQWGAYNYNIKQDVARWDFPVKKLSGKSVEVFTIQFENKNNMADLAMSWDDICVILPIQFNEPKQ